MNRFINKLLSFFFPHRCISCGRVMETAGFCEECNLNAAEATVSGAVFGSWYDGLVPLYYYYGAARHALLNMKFYGRPYIAGYFGDLLGRKVYLTYGTAVFDAICFVPMGKKAQRKRKYNQSELLAKSVSDTLGIAVLPAGLVKVRENKIQHRLNAKQREQNVAGAYAVWDNVRGKRILLIDDIKTTGATLNECAKMLRAAGAVEIVCAVVAVSGKTGL